jgi:hypothetical protein
MVFHDLPSKTLFCGLMLALLGCPGDDGAGEEGADTGTTSAASSTTEPSPTTDTTAGETTATSTMGETADTGTTGPGGGACGELECTEAEWCDYTDDVCGAKGSNGSTSCEPRPEGCGDIYAPVCGCDGLVHGNECDASAVGVDVDAEGDCEAPGGYFRCGYRFCNPEYEFCQIQYSDIAGYGHSYACVSPAMECPGGITCDCLGEEFCFEFGCNETPDGGIEIGCPGG